MIDFLNDEANAPLKLIAYSTLGFTLLKVCYDLLLIRNFSPLYSFVFPIGFGLTGSLLSAGCMYLVVIYSPGNEVTSSLLWMGMFSIFPVWQYLFGLNIEIENGAVVRN